MLGRGFLRSRRNDDCGGVSETQQQRPGHNKLIARTIGRCYSAGASNPAPLEPVLELHRQPLRRQTIPARIAITFLSFALTALSLVPRPAGNAPHRAPWRRASAPANGRVASDTPRPVPTPGDADTREQHGAAEFLTAVSDRPAESGATVVEPFGQGPAPREGAPTADPPFAAPTETPVPATNAPSPTATTGPRSVLRDSMVVSIWGNPDGLGILGELTPEAAMESLRNLGRRYQALLATRTVVPAFFLVYATAQREPTENGLYLRYLPDQAVWPYLTLAHQNDGLLFLDLQLGLSDVRSQLERLRPYLLDPAIHVALDPEYAVRPGQRPGDAAGSLDGSDLNAAQEYLQRLVEENGLPDKIVVVHQFQDGVITNGDRVSPFPNVHLVVNMDAFGDIRQKVEKYEQFARRPYAEYASFNLFLKLDQALLSEEEVVRLSPQPAMVIYQ